MQNIFIPPTAPKGILRHPDIVTTDAIEVVYAAMDGYVRGIKKPDKDLVALRNMLLSAMLHSSDTGGTAVSKQNFYNHVAHIACHTKMEWHCTMTRALFNAFQIKAENGIVMAKRILEGFGEVRRLNPKLNVLD